MAHLDTMIEGYRVEKEKKEFLTNKLSQAYFDNDRSIWLTLPVGAVEVDKSIFQTDGFLKISTVYMYVRHEDAPVFSISPVAVNAFFIEQKPYEDIDIYVFDEKLKWCIFSSSEFKDDSDFHIYFSGEF